MEDWILFCIFIPICYIIGSINFAVVICSFQKKDIHALGSGNPGTMNMLRSMGKGLGFLTFLLDFSKGLAASLIGMFVFTELSDIAPYVLGFSAMLGHVFPIFNKFKGGKGVATTLGVFAVAHPISWGVAFIILLIYIIIAKSGFIGSLIGVYIPAITSLVVNSIYRVPYWYVSVIFTVLFIFSITFAHRANFKRLILGTELTLAHVPSDDISATSSSEELDASTEDIASTSEELDQHTDNFDK